MSNDRIACFRNHCVKAGVHALTNLAVLSRVEVDTSCREVCIALDMAHSTVWRATIALEEQGLICVENVPHRSRTGRRMKLALSDKGRALLDNLRVMLGS